MITAIKLSAGIFLAFFAQARPRIYAADPYRVAVVAVAAENAVAEYLPKWRYGEAQLAGAIASGILAESGLDADVHSGANNRNGHCLMQIHSTNGLWRKAGAPSYDSLMGVALEATEWCLRTGTMTLLSGANYCHKRRFYTHWQLAMWTMYATGNRCNPWSRTARDRQSTQNLFARGTWIPTDEHIELVRSVMIRNEEK